MGNFGNRDLKCCVVIPARWKSSRFPGKPLVPLLGKPMILWVAELSADAVGRRNVFVATDDERISSVVTAAGFQSIITEEEALTGTDRVAMVAEHIEADIYINVQGDEPLVSPLDILRVRDEKLSHMNCIVNGFSWIGKTEDPRNINIPKVVTDESNYLVYMSRAELPGCKEMRCRPIRYKKQVCIYAYTREELFSFRDFGRKSELENCEDIELLRFLELNKQVFMVEMEAASLAVDVPEDVVKVEGKLSCIAVDAKFGSGAPPIL